MFRSYIKIAFRSLAKNRLTSFINLFGLGLSMSVGLTISLLGFLVFIAISVASLGLLGLVVYTVEVKRKEISIRKIAGADKKQLVSMLSNGFIRLLFLAGLIATPIGFIAGFLFLQNFAERTSFGLFHLATCFLLVFGIGLITIISQTYKAPSVNPAITLRTE